jgi:hypothetical protein
MQTTMATHIPTPKQHNTTTRRPKPQQPHAIPRQPTWEELLGRR